MAYLHAKSRSQILASETTNFDLYRELDDQEISEHPTAASRFAWVATVNSQTSAYVASMALQRNVRTPFVLCGFREAYERFLMKNLQVCAMSL